MAKKAQNAPFGTTCIRAQVSVCILGPCSPPVCLLPQFSFSAALQLGETQELYLRLCDKAVAGSISSAEELISLAKETLSQRKSEVGWCPKVGVTSSIFQQMAP